MGTSASTSVSSTASSERISPASESRQQQQQHHHQHPQQHQPLHPLSPPSQNLHPHPQQQQQQQQQQQPSHAVSQQPEASGTVAAGTVSVPATSDAGGGGVRSGGGGGASGSRQAVGASSLSCHRYQDPSTGVSNSSSNNSSNYVSASGYELLYSGRGGSGSSAVMAKRHTDGTEDKRHMVRTNKVAPVIIKDCRQEFQDTSELKDAVVMGCMGDNMPEHPLIKGCFFLVSDHNPQTDYLQTLKELKTPNFHRAQQVPVYASGQPTMDGLKKVLNKLREEGHQDIFVFNLRSEPVLFVNADGGDFEPYSLREQDNLHRFFLTHDSALDADEYEACVRKEVLGLSALAEDKLFYFYREPTTPGSEVPMEHWRKALSLDDQLLTASEVFSALSFGKPHVRYNRLCFPQNRAPEQRTVDAFLAPFKENPRFLKRSSPDFPALYFVCGTGKGRSTLGKAMGCLLYAHKMGFPEGSCSAENQACSTTKHQNQYCSGSSTPDHGWKSPAKAGSKSAQSSKTAATSPKGTPGGTTATSKTSIFSSASPSTIAMAQRGLMSELRAVQLLMEELRDGWNIKREVDWAVERCSALCSLSSSVVDTKIKLDSFPISNNIDADHFRSHLHQLCLDYTERYCFLLIFNAYLHDQFSQGLCLSYHQWLQRQPGIVTILTNLNLSKRTEPASLVSSGRRSLVSDSYIGLDVLSSKMDVKVENFRRFMGLPIYGMAQPARDGLSRVVSYLLHKKQGFGDVVIINLRNDMVIECDETTYHVQDSATLGEPVQVYGATGKELEGCEEALLKEVKSKKTIVVHMELGDPTVTITPNSVLSPDDMWQNQQLQTLDMSYRRLPIQYDHCFQEKEFDAIQQLLFSELKTDKAWTGNRKAFVFHCRTGKSRSSLAMAVASMVFFHMRGFPYGAKPGEQELVSCPNRSYTLGEFVVVMRLVRMLPEGSQRKREVDFVLDTLFETMSPMLFHLREVIFVTFNKIRSANCESVRERRRRQSVDFMERYIYLILYNTYLSQEKHSHFARPFSQWMKEVASEEGVYDVLDNLDFRGLEDPPYPHYRTRQQRWTARHLDTPFYGRYV